MIIILSTPHRQQALVRAELMRQRNQAGRAIERIHADMIANAEEFIELTENWIASNPPALRGEQ